jgi:AraC-like DNA-binding protein
MAFFKESESDLKSECPFRLFTIRYAESAQDLKPHYAQETLEILIPLRMNGSLLVDGRRVSLSRVPAIVIPPGSIHSGTIRKQKGRIIVFQLNLNSISRYFRIEGFFSPSSLVTLSPIYRHLILPVMQLQRTLEKETFGPVTLRPEEHLPLLAKILALLHRASFSPRAGKQDKKKLPWVIRDIVIWTEQNASGEVSLDWLSARFGFNKSYFCRLFKKHTGFTYMDYLLGVRLEKAKHFLSQGHSVTDACLQSGFSNLSYFIVRFKRKFGKTPLEYKRTL